MRPFGHSATFQNCKFPLFRFRNLENLNFKIRCKLWLWRSERACYQCTNTTQGSQSSKCDRISINLENIFFYNSKIRNLKFWNVGFSSFVDGPLRENGKPSIHFFSLGTKNGNSVKWKKVETFSQPNFENGIPFYREGTVVLLHWTWIIDLVKLDVEYQNVTGSWKKH